MKRTCLVMVAVGASAVLSAPRALAQGENATDSSSSGSGDAAPAAGGAAGGSANANAASSTATTAPTANDEKITDVLEDKGQGYYFLGVNYRGTIVPGFLVNLFVDQGPSAVYSNTVGLSFDYRKDHFSIIPGVNFTDYSMSPTIFVQKGKSGVGNTTVVQSQLKAIYATVDLLWSVPIAKGGQADFEFGFGVGLGGVFGDLYNTWVSDQATGGPVWTANDGTKYNQCIATGPNGCNANQHQNSQVNKVGPGNGYREPNWFDGGGGSVPTVFPWISLPILGFRFKPIKELEMRLNGGFSITGFFFNFAAYYGFENPKSTPK